MYSAKRLFSLVLLVTVGAAFTPAHAQQNEFTVDATGDAADANPGDGTCATSGDNCTLRAAIQEANNTSNVSGGPDRIIFDIGGSTPHTIQPSSGNPLPTITDPVEIDATTEPDYSGSPVVELDGANLSGESGLILDADDSQIEGLSIVNFTGSFGKDYGGIKVLSGGGGTISGCYLGIDVSEQAAENRVGIVIDGANDVTIGGTTDAARNVISGNGKDGINTRNNARNVTIQGNYIGTNPQGDGEIANGGDGISLTSTSNSMIGGSSEGARNLISGSNKNGIAVSGRNNTIQNNYIGTDVTGSFRITNDKGILVEGGDHLIGGADQDEGNVISGNNGQGIKIAEGAHEVLGNLIGTTADGSQVLGNGLGIKLDPDTEGNTIGGIEEGAGNVISDNGGSGIEIRSNRNTIQGNLIGTDENGTSGLGNEKWGIEVTDGETQNQIGGTSTGARNVIADNGQPGIEIGGSSSTGTKVQGNYIGTSADGSARLPNEIAGILITSGNQQTTIGGNVDGAGNLISGHVGLPGILVENESSQITIQGNRIGTGPDGESALGNEVGLRLTGKDVTDITIGGTADGAGNLISGNTDDGIEIIQSDGNTVQGNDVGLSSSSESLANGAAGISIQNASDNVIGGTGSGAGNAIAHNGTNGVVIQNSNSVGNAVRGNRTFQNSDLGIDLADDGTTSNDDGDGDDGVNRLQNFPIIEGTDYDPQQNVVTVEFQVPSDPDASGSGASNYGSNGLDVDVYRIDADEEEGRDYLGTLRYTATDFRSGPVQTKTFTPQKSVTIRDKIVLTATDADGNTSEFSAPSMQLNGPPTANADEASTDEDTPLSPGTPGVLGNDTDPENDDLTVSTVNGDSSNVGSTITLDSGAELTVNEDGSYTYDPTAGFQELDQGDSETETFTYSAGDEFRDDQAAVTLSISGVNDAPTVSTNAGLTVDEDSMSVITPQELSGSDPDDTAEQLTYSVTSAPSNGTLLVDGSEASTFTQVDLENENVKYRHDGSETTSDEFAFDLTDDNGDGPTNVTFSISVNPVNDAPTVATNAGLTVEEGATARITTSELSASDPDDEPSALTFSVTSAPSNGTLIVDGTEGASSFTQKNLVDETVSYEHDGSETTSDQFTFELSDDDGAGPSGDDQFTFTINPQNDAPTVVSDTATTDEDTPVTVDVLANDSDPDNSLDPSTVTVASSPSNGSTTVDDETGEITYTPLEDFNGSDSFTYTVDDQEGAMSGEASVSITVNPVPDVTLVDGRNDGNGGTDYTPPAGQPGTGNNPVGRFSLSADEAGASLSEVTIAFNGSNAKGIDAVGLWTSDDDSFEPGSDSQVARTTSFSNTLTFGGIGATVPTENRFVFVAVDLASGASGTVTPVIASEADISFSGGTLSVVNGTATSTFTDAFLSASSTALPVELTSFNATKDGESVVLRWKTASETGNAGFRVQHRRAGASSETGTPDTTWSSLGFVDGAGTTSEPQSYRFSVGENLEPGAHNFRLKQVDLDGSTHLSEIVSIELQMEAPVVLTPPAPNPVRQRGRVELAVRKSKRTTLAVYNILGQKVRTLFRGRPSPGETRTVSFDASQMTSGTYFLRLRTGKHTRTRRITVVR